MQRVRIKKLERLSGWILNLFSWLVSNLIPEKSKSSKSKTNICRRTSNPVWNSTLIFEDVSHQELKERALELNIWNHDRLATKEFLGGVRLNLGTGKSFAAIPSISDSPTKSLNNTRRVPESKEM